MEKKKKPFTTETVIKPRQLIHVERKAPKMAQEIFNVLLRNAWPAIERGKTYSISLKNLQYYVPSVKNVAHLRKQLKELSIRIEYNIFNKVQTTSGYFVLLPEAQLIIQKGVGRIEYSFTNKMIEIFSALPMYAKISLLIQKQFKGGKYGLDLYELCFDYKNIKTTPFLSVEQLKKYFGVEDQKSYQQFKYFKLCVITKGIKDVNKYTDLTIRSETRKEGRAVTHIRFHIRKKEKFSLAIPPKLEKLPELEKEQAIGKETVQEQTETIEAVASTKSELAKNLKKLGVSAAYTKKAVSEYSREQIEEAVQVAKEEIERKGVEYPDGFIKRALEEGWQSKAGAERRKQIEDEEKRKKEKEAEEAEEKRQAELYRQEKEQYASMTSEERFEHVLKTSSQIKKIYDSQNPEQQESLKEHAYYVFDNFDRFGLTYKYISQWVK